MSNSQIRTDRWIPTAFVLFFLALAALQAWFVTLAQSTFTGLVTDVSQTLPLSSRLPGSKMSLRFEATGAGRGRLFFAFGDQNTADPIDVLTATAERTTRFPQILPVAFSAAENGTYVADLNVPLAGRWTVRILISQGGKTSEHLFPIEVSL